MLVTSELSSGRPCSCSYWLTRPRASLSPPEGWPAHRIAPPAGWINQRPKVSVVDAGVLGLVRGPRPSAVAQPPPDKPLVGRELNQETSGPSGRRSLSPPLRSGSARDRRTLQNWPATGNNRSDAALRIKRRRSAGPHAPEYFGNLGAVPSPVRSGQCGSLASAMVVDDLDGILHGAQRQPAAGTENPYAVRQPESPKATASSSGPRSSHPAPARSRPARTAPAPQSSSHPRSPPRQPGAPSPATPAARQPGRVGRDPVQQPGVQPHAEHRPRAQAGHRPAGCPWPLQQPISRRMIARRSARSRPTTTAVLCRCTGTKKALPDFPERASDLRWS